MKISIFILSISFFLAGCSTYVENKKAEEFIPIHQEISFSEEDNTIDGSIYNQKSSGFFASDRRAKNVGDILTITLNESLSASKSTTNTTSKADTFAAKISRSLEISSYLFLCSFSFLLNALVISADLA